MVVVRHFLGFAEESDARVRGECVGADCFVGRMPRRRGWPQGMRLPPRGTGPRGEEGGRQRPSDESRTTAFAAARLCLVQCRLGCLQRRRVRRCPRRQE